MSNYTKQIISDDLYAKAYRKLKDLDNEIAILDEGIAQLKGKS